MGWERALLYDLVLGGTVSAALYRAARDRLTGMASNPTTLLLDRRHLDAIKQLRDEGETTAVNIVGDLAKLSQTVARRPIPTVTAKTHAPPSGDMHDYCSLAKYWWPDPASKEGLPYTNHDGHINPECYDPRRYDFLRLRDYSDHVLLLAVTAYLTGNQKLGQASAQRLKAWHVEPTTRQNPHFSYAQIVPGRTATRATRLIEARYLVSACEAANLLRQLDLLSAEDFGEVQSWFASLLDWMQTSPDGQQARAAQNNIGFWFDAAFVCFADFCGEAELAKRTLQDQTLTRMVDQIASTGSLPREMKRARPQDYVTFTLISLALLDRAGQKHGVDLWNDKAADGKVFSAAYDWFQTMPSVKYIRDNSALSLPERRVGLDHLLAFQTVSKAQARLQATAEIMTAEHEKLSKQNDQLQTSLNELSSSLTAALEAEREARATEKAALQEASAEALRQQTMLTAALEAEREARKKEKSSLEKASATVRQQQARLKSHVRQLSRKLKRVNKKRTRERKWMLALATPALVLLSPILIPAYLLKRRRKATRTPRAQVKRLRQTERDPAAKLEERSGNPVATKPSTNSVVAMPSSAPVIAKGRNRTPLEALHDGINFNESVLREDYIASGLVSMPDSFALVRIIGNDLVPRHAIGQSRTNLRFVLENEPALDDCKKHWIVNRIFDPEERSAILKLLEDHEQEYTEIGFHAEEYRQIGWDFETLPVPGYLASKEYQELNDLQRDRVRTALYRLKNLYVMNNNGARNTAFDVGLALDAKWVLPFDGNCFVTTSAWEEITHAVRDRPFLRRFAVPMQRMSDNEALLRDDFIPEPLEEPQLLFRRDAPERFNPEFPYGRRPKVELFWHLGITGPWERWKDDPWDIRRRRRAPDAGQYGVAGWVARMFSGMRALEQQGDTTSFKSRGLLRQEAILAAIDHIDSRVHGSSACGFPAFYDSQRLGAARQALRDAPESQLGWLARRIVQAGEAALSDGPYSVTQKTTLPPSGKLHDYWHPAPYWWPDPSKPDGRPYIRKDGQRVPGTRMYEPESTKFDRTRLQLMFDNTTALALAWKLTGRDDFAEHGARLVRTWFLDPATAMAPHLTYAQVRRGHNNDEGVATGIIELKDFYYFLDAVRFLEESGVLSEADRSNLASWLHQYLEWLETSPQGLREVRGVNNHGTYYDLQVAAICAYLGDAGKLRDVMLRAQSRLIQQIEIDGTQPDEMKRTITQHYVFFNLQGFLNIFRISKAAGHGPLDFASGPGARLRAALNWILQHDLKAWPYEQIDAFDHDRIWPLLNAAQDLGMITEADLPEQCRGCDKAELKPVFDPHYAVNPYWNLSASQAQEPVAAP